MTQSTESDTQKILAKLDVISSDIVEIKVTLAKHDERFNSIDQRFDAIDKRFEAVDKRFEAIEGNLKAQDTKIWGLVSGIVLALFGLLAKLAFFPTPKI